MNYSLAGGGGLLVGKDVTAGALCSCVKRAMVAGDEDA